MNRIEELKATIATYQKLIAEIQEQCSHPPAALTKKHGGGQGEDGYWTELRCGLCEKVWVEEGSV